MKAGDGLGSGRLAEETEVEGGTALAERSLKTGEISK
jgi:hypothetical protein